MTTRRSTHGRLLRLGCATALSVLLTLGGCSSGAEDTGDAASHSGGGSSAEVGTDAGALEAAKGVADRSGAGEAGSEAASAPVQSRKVISTASVTLAAEDLREARSAIDRLLGRYGGFVAAEESENDRRGRLTVARLELRVPSPHFAATLTAFDDIGTVLRRTRQQVDVTTEVIDVNSRVATQEVSLGRLRRFLDRARSLDATIRLEAEIARREADLASLRAQQEYLEDQTSLATITVQLRRTDIAAPEEDRDDAGFLSGLAAGTTALLRVLTVGLTVLGAALPFAALAALLGLPLWLWTRARRHHPAGPGAGTGGGAGAGAGPQPDPT